MAVNFTNNYPYTDFHELNLDWLIKEMKEKISGSWVTITIHPNEWDGNNQCVVTGLTGLTATTPILWSMAPNTIDDSIVNNTVLPVSQGEEQITFSSSGVPNGDVIIYIVIGG